MSVRELRQAAHAARQRQALEEAAEKAAQVQLVRAKTAEGRARQRKASLEERRAAATRNVQEKLKLDVKLRVRFVTWCTPKRSLTHTHTLQQLEDEQSQQRRRKRAHVAAVERRRRHKQSNRVFASSLLRAHNLMARHMTAGRLAVARQEAEEEAALRRQEFEETKRARRIHASIAAQVGGRGMLSVSTCAFIGLLIGWFLSVTDGCEEEAGGSSEAEASHCLWSGKAAAAGSRRD